MLHWEYGITLLAFTLLGGYHFYLFWRIRRRPLSTAVGLSRRIRKLWVKRIIQEGRDILAVQTLRNWTMAATLLASTAILLGLGLLNVAFTTEQQPQLSKLLNYLGYDSELAWLLKLVILSGDFFFAFFNFTLAIRYYNHTGFMINVPACQEAGVSAKTVTEILQRGANHYTLGMRGYYLAIPLSLWLFGSVWLLGGTLLLLVVLYRLDRFV
ncbi:DUF599 domain-containing protein [Nitrosococcus oceani]|uniref:DUF599 domain-containing protein n=2 Tax=Nitrosococcus oceani TaxID=1229 RepID=Q3JB90_NITOC|nr:DUF599 domain-containing protein [Nitrosococcus oceani]KFI19634.1 hypothetical protein IB75_07415 [Nitrosococcus oceani C-27]ABA57906.1 Protein of unknown function DUF599 [Nitrosococcus oceani ATCC 19707]EDZ67253.1 conserved hypothetical protein [Nitrosococcus oceani AFC27]KFI22498.1 hypothetical protein HW44_09350 [Nitrosococcus oceani]GEM19549.1 hypothetical protein NONS58_09410 [Nitrosococcus oceani]